MTKPEDSQVKMIIELESVEVNFNPGKESLKVLDIPHWYVKEGDRVAAVTGHV